MVTLLADVVRTSTEVRGTRSRSAKVELLAEQLRAFSAEEAAVGASYLAGRFRQERLSVGWAAVRDVEAAPAERPSLHLREVDEELEGLAALSGSGSRAAREQRLRGLLARATATEQEFLRELILGNVRQGALEGVVVKALAAAAAAQEDAVRRAVMLAGDLGAVAQAVLGDGAQALASFRLVLFTPVQPMLASTAADVEEAVGDGPAAVEWKLDGARIQVHRRGGEVRVYTRNLRDVTARNPEAVAAALAMPADELVLDGEVLALDAGAHPQPFQRTMSRFGRGGGSPAVLHPFFFDVLRHDGADLLDVGTFERRAVLERLVPQELLVPQTVVASADGAAAVLDEALARGHEGVMVKDLDAGYAAGRRGAAWRKVKPVHTLDLVVLAVEWGSGRRRGWLSNLHLGARDEQGGFVMLGKTFKGMTDEMLAWQTERFLALESGRDGHVVHVRAEQVVEIAFDGVQRSSRYPGGVALRFARVRAYREDKTAAEADTIAAVRAFLRG